MSKERVGEGIAERLNSGPAREEVKRPIEFTLYCGSCRTTMSADAFKGECPVCGNGTVQEIPAEIGPAEEWRAYALSLERKIEERSTIESALRKDLGMFQRMYNHAVELGLDPPGFGPWKTLRSQAEALAAQLEKARCTCKQEWKDQCPRCGGKLKPVTRDAHSPLNEEQFDSVRAGDYYCETCVGTEARTGYKYWWKGDLEWNQITCARCEALAAYRAGKEKTRSTEP